VYVIPVCPAQIVPVLLAVMEPGIEGALVVISTYSSLEAPLPKLLDGVTLTAPPAEPAVAVMLLLPCPEVMLQPEGTSHV
jgi:hypothetical protein